MGYINDNLLPEENLLHEAKLHWIIFVMPAITSIILIGIPFLIKAVIDNMTSEFGVTDKRVMIKTGLISRNTTETMLHKVEAINVDQGIIGRILNYGTISIIGTGGTRNEFKRIHEPLLFRNKVQEQLTK